MPEVDLIVHNAVVHTMDDDQPSATAFTSAGGRLVAVGGEELLGQASRLTRVIDAGGAAVIPGMIDSHVHHNMAGENDLFKLNIAAGDSLDDVCRAVSRWIAEKDLADGVWVTGGGWGATLLDDMKLPESLAKLDAASPRNPVLLRDDSHHQKWANSQALERVGIGPSTADPEGGTIWRDATGAATGLLLEAAAGMADAARMSEVGQDGAQYAAACSSRAIDILHSVGITGFQDASSTKEVLAGLQLLDEKDELKAWAVTSMPIHDAFFGFSMVGRPLVAVGEEFRTARHRPDFTKIWLDGVPMNQTTALLEPYLPSDEHGHEHCGATNMPAEELEGWLRYIDEKNLGVKVHATGDASVRMILDAVERVRADGLDLRVQAAHITFIHPDDLRRFAELDVVAEVSPAIWNPSVLTEAIRHVVPEELVEEHMYPNRDLVDTGALTVAGSDWPVPPTPNPWIPIYGLVTRKDPEGDFPGAFNPGQALTVQEALRLYTSSAARATGLDDVAGRIAPGLSTDFVVLDADPLEVDAERLKEIAPVQTWFQGECVFTRE